MEAAHQGADAQFNNISATPEECTQRQTSFYRFLNEYLVYDSGEVENSSQASGVSGTLIQILRIAERRPSGYTAVQPLLACLLCCQDNYEHTLLNLAVFDAYIDF